MSIMIMFMFSMVIIIMAVCVNVKTSTKQPLIEISRNEVDGGDMKRL